LITVHINAQPGAGFESAPTVCETVVHSSAPGRALLLERGLKCTHFMYTTVQYRDEKLAVRKVDENKIEIYEVVE